MIHDLLNQVFFGSNFSTMMNDSTKWEGGQGGQSLPPPVPLWTTTNPRPPSVEVMTRHRTREKNKNR